MRTSTKHRESANTFVKYKQSVYKSVSSRETKVYVCIFLAAAEHTTKCFRRTFNSQCCKVVCNLIQPIREFWTNQTARPQTIKYVQSSFISETTMCSAWLIHNIGIIAEPLFAPAKFVWQQFCLQQERRFVGAIQSCTVVRAVLFEIRWTSYKRI